MTSAPVHDPLGGHLLTPENAAVLLIGYQPSPLAAVRRTARNASHNARRKASGRQHEASARDAVNTEKGW
jgi:hypothetical protein